MSQTFKLSIACTEKRKQELVALFKGSITTNVELVQMFKGLLAKEKESGKAKARQEFIRNIENSIARERKIIEEINNWRITN